MKTFFGALIDKNDSKLNSKLINNLQKEFKKNLRKSTIDIKEHNTFLFPEDPHTLYSIHNLSSWYQTYPKVDLTNKYLYPSENLASKKEEILRDIT